MNKFPFLVIDGGTGKIRSIHPTYDAAQKSLRKARTGATLVISYSAHPFREGDVVQDDDKRLKAAYGDAIND